MQVTPDDPKTGPDRTIIYVVPVSWKVARLIWSYAHTSDLSFYNINNAKVRFCASPLPFCLIQSSSLAAWVAYFALGHDVHAILP